MDLCSYTSHTFYSGTRKLLGKQTIYSLQIHDGVLFATGSSVDGTAGKVTFTFFFFNVKWKLVATL